MGGICGIVSVDGGPVDPAPLVAMSATLRHRGPDSDGSPMDGPVALAIHVLSTRSDAEGLVHLYEERGPDFAHSLGGIVSRRREDLSCQLWGRHAFTLRHDRRARLPEVPAA